MKMMVITLSPNIETGIKGEIKFREAANKALGLQKTSRDQEEDNKDQKMMKAENKKTDKKKRRKEKTMIENKRMEIEKTRL